MREVYNYYITYFEGNEYKNMIIFRVVDSKVDKTHAETTFTFIESVSVVDNKCKLKEITLPYARVDRIDVYNYYYDEDDNILRYIHQIPRNKIRMRRGGVGNTKWTNIRKKFLSTKCTKEQNL